MEIYGSRYVKLRITSATEKHASGKLIRLRVEPIMSNFCRALMGASSILAGVLMLDMWPFSRTAVLIPLAWYAMYAVNRWRVSMPILGLIDEAAENAGFYPVPSRKPSSAPGPGSTAAQPPARVRGSKADCGAGSGCRACHAPTSDGKCGITPRVSDDTHRRICGHGGIIAGIGPRSCWLQC